LWWGEKEFSGHHEQGVDAMGLFCSLSKAARIVLWVVIVSALFGLILGYQAGSSNTEGTNRPAATADARN
jgi:hypothetical protein